MPEYKTMTLSQCAAFDRQHGLRDKLTGWGIICQQRYLAGNSRRVRVALNGNKKNKTKK